MEPSLIEPTSVNQFFPKQVHQTQHNHCLYGPVSIVARSLAMFMGGDIPKILWGTHQSTTIGGGYLRSGEMPNERCKLGLFQDADVAGKLYYTDSEVNFRWCSVQFVDLIRLFPT